MSLISNTEQSYYEGGEYGGYQFIKLDDLISNFIVAYTGEEKILDHVKRSDVVFHAKRGLQELSYDTLRSPRTLEVELGPTNSIRLPQDYVNYIKFTYVDEGGAEHTILPSLKSSNPRSPLQDNNYEFMFDSNGNILEAFDSNTIRKFFNAVSQESEKQKQYNEDSLGQSIAYGQRYGLDPQFANANGLFILDNDRGRVYFSSEFSGKIITIHYISDGLGVDDSEMQIHKFAEEALYKYILHAVVSTRVGMPEYIIQRYKRERFAAIRQAKLRLSNIKIEELTQVMRGKSKQIKH